MNYRHIYHAGNFADLIKHAVLLDLLAEFRRGPPFTVIDTHAGAGLYDLAAPEALRTGEAEAGIDRLLAAADPPASLSALSAKVLAVQAGRGRVYPGSPLLAAGALRPGDRLLACEARADDGAALRRWLADTPAAEVLSGDGWLALPARAKTAKGPLLVLIDPPFERPDDHERAARAAAQTLRARPGAVVALWTPIKDLATFDAFLSAVEDAVKGAPLLVVEVRLRSLADPLRLNGCAMLVVNPPRALQARAAAAGAWIGAHLGQAGALARAWRPGDDT
jgi:23S rRNA (adenine2030-N6)-methyltransferase